MKPISAEKDKKRILIQRIQDLPTLPTTLAKIIAVVESPTSTAVELGEVISKDPSISSMILKLVNSAFYGHLRQISTISHAIVILGFQTVKAMALGVSIFQSAPQAGGSMFNRSRFWIHSIGVATCSKILFQRVKKCEELDGETVFLSGLLHDLGKLVFDNFFNDEYRKVAAEAGKNHEWIRDAERRLLEIDHNEAGYFLAQRWQFPAPVINAIRFHHDLPEGPPETCSIAAMVHVADYCCRKAKIGDGGDSQEIELDPRALEILGVDQGVLQGLLDRLEQDREIIESFTLDFE